MNEISFGPFIAKTRGPSIFVASPEIHPINLAIEFSTPSGGYVMDLYFKTDHSDGFQQYWHEGVTDFYIHHSQLCREVTYDLLFHRMIQGQLFLPLRSVLLPLYRKFKFQTAVQEFLVELRQAFGNPLDIAYPHESLFTEKVRAKGFRSSQVFAFGRKLHVSFQWAPTVDHGKLSPVSLSLPHLEFVPGPGRTLGVGKWGKYRRGSGDHLSLLVMPEVKKLARNPIQLLSDEGVEKLMNKFEWTPVSLLPKAELDAARKKFMLDHRDLWPDMTALAKALVAEGLYSKSTDISTLKKRLRVAILPKLTEGQ